MIIQNLVLDFTQKGFYNDFRSYFVRHTKTIYVLL